MRVGYKIVKRLLLTGRYDREKLDGLYGELQFLVSYRISHFITEGKFVSLLSNVRLCGAITHVHDRILHGNRTELCIWLDQILLLEFSQSHVLCRLCACCCIRVPGLLDSSFNCQSHVHNSKHELWLFCTARGNTSMGGMAQMAQLDLLVLRRLGRRYFSR